MRLSPHFPASLVLLLATATAQDSGSTFGHARARELAELGRLPSARDVVVRDLVNYHRHRLPLPAAGEDVALDVRFDRPAARAGDEVWLQIGYTTGSLGDRSLAPPCAVAIVVDTSGSMAEAGKLTAVQAGLRAFADRLRPDDEVALVGFSTEARVIAGMRRRGDGRWLRDAIDGLRAEGSTNLHAGLMLGIDELTRADTGSRTRRAIVLTDGIANTGVTDPARIVGDATARAETTIDISTIGVGQDLDVPTLQRIADGARGLFHFVADSADVQKVFVNEAEALLAPVARRVRLQVTLPDCVEPLQWYDERLRAGATDRELRASLPDLNAGATGVVMVRCRLVTGGMDTAVARATMSFESAASRSETSVGSMFAGWRAMPRGLVLAPSPDAIDLEVRKNAAIAVLARGLAEMAASCDARRWADADRSLQRAVDDARGLFPSTDDADLQRVREIADGHARTLRRYVDRFRDV